MLGLELAILYLSYFRDTTLACCVRNSGRKNGRTFDIGLKRLESTLDNLLSKGKIGLGRHARITAGMRQFCPRDDPVGLGLLRDLCHGRNESNRNSPSFNFFADHSTAASIRPSGGYEQGGPNTFGLHIVSHLFP